MDRRLNEEELAVFGGPRHQAFPKRSPVAGNDGSGQTAARSVALRPRVLIDWPADPHSDPIRWRPLRRPRKCEPATGSRKKGIDDWRPVTEDRAVAGFVPDGLQAALRSWRFNISPAPARFAKRASKTLSSAKVMFSCLRPPFGLGLSALMPPWSVRAVHRAQRHTHRCRNRALGHSTLAQQHHLHVLALRRRDFPLQRSLQPPNLGFAAFDHLFPPYQVATANQTHGPTTIPAVFPPPGPRKHVMELV
jgi:hypothetical protein